MTTEANDNDRRVSEAYRDVSIETTPPELDRRILSMAADDLRERYWIPRTWVRPVAWAATIALSLAFVLEISQVSDEPAARMDADIAGVLEGRVQAEEESVKAKDDSAARQQINKRSNAPAAAKVAAPPAYPASAPSPASTDPAADAPASDSASVAQDFEADGVSLLREAEEQVRMRSEAGRLSTAYEEEKEQSPDCDEEARATATSWFGCVQALRDAGHKEAAQLELEALLAEHPDFREPIPDR